MELNINNTFLCNMDEFVDKYSSWDKFRADGTAH